MFNLGLPELLVIFGVALLAFGPDKLPDLARTLGKLAADLRRQTDGLRREFYNEVYKPVDDSTRQFRDASKSLTASVKSIERELQNQLIGKTETPPPAAGKPTVPPEPKIALAALSTEIAEDNRAQPPTCENCASNDLSKKPENSNG